MYIKSGLFMNKRKKLRVYFLMEILNHLP